MDKWQAQDHFWNSFGIPAYDQNTEFTSGDQPSYPHITYEAQAGILEQPLALSASIWYRSGSWKEVSQKADEILKAIKGGRVMSIDNGYLWFMVPDRTPFAQRVASGDDAIKRILISVEAECLTAD